MPSFYQDELYRALSSRGSIDVHIIYAHDVSHDRRRLGWINPSGGYSSVRLTGKWSIMKAIRHAWMRRDEIHVVGGIWAEPAFAAALAVLGCTGSVFAVLSEPPDPRIPRSGPKLWIRQTFGRWVATRCGAHAMPISTAASSFLNELGFTNLNTYPFLYTRSRPVLKMRENRVGTASDVIEFLFVGQLTSRKGVDILVQALAPFVITNERIKLALVGHGEAAEELRHMVTSLGIIDRVTFEGTLPSNRVLQRIARSSILVLPSRWDGWGLVVNEAFSVGIPVIVSDMCGARDLVDQGINGWVFKSDNVESLRDAIRHYLAADRTILSDKAQEMGNLVATESVIPYLEQCINHMEGLTSERPVPGWETQRAEGSRSIVQ